MSSGRGTQTLRNVKQAQQIAKLCSQWFRGPCRCGRILRFRFQRKSWDLFAYDSQLADWVIVEQRRCPNCKQSFHEFSEDELKDRFCPGGMAE